MNRTAIFIFILFSLACKEKFNARLESPATGYLVVEALVSNSPGATLVRLSRSVALTVGQVTAETGASVWVEGDDNSQTALTESEPGLYRHPQVPLQNGHQYRLRIKTQAGVEYASSYEPYRPTPAIDTINWKQTGEGVELYVSSHDDNNSSIYYKWDFEETWEIHSAFANNLEYDSSGFPPFRTYSINMKFAAGIIDTSLYYCYATQPSTTIEIGSTARLTEDRINYLLNVIPNGSRKLAARYSLLVRQYAITKEAYEFLERMKKNTETTGSIFDPQPSEPGGDVYNLSDPAELVVGYVHFCSASEKRIFIDHDDLSGWEIPSSCQRYTIQNNSDSIKKAIYMGLMPGLDADGYFESPMAGGRYIIVTFYASEPTCIDCTLSGASNQKPDFW